MVASSAVSDTGAKFVYGLVDPRDGKVRYVGGSKEPAARLTAHLQYSAWKREGREWLGGLASEGLRPDIRLFTTGPVKNWRAVERRVQDLHGETLLDHHGRARAINRTYSRAEIGASLRSAREAQGLSPVEAAALHGVSAATISRWENGARLPQISELMRVADRYGVTVAELLPMGEPSQGASADVARAKGVTHGKRKRSGQRVA